MMPCDRKYDCGHRCVASINHHEHRSIHLIEDVLAHQVIASVAPEDMREQMYERFYKNHLAYLAMHPVANFVVQAMLAAINKSPQVIHLKNLRVHSFTIYEGV